MDDDKIEKMQILLNEEIIKKNYDKTAFINFCLSKKENGDDLNEWSLEELKEIVNEFQNLNIPINTVRIYFPRTYYLSRKNIYLKLYLGNTSKILDQELLQFDWELSEKEFVTIYNNNIKVSIYEHNIFLKDQFKGCFSINLYSVRNYNDSKQKYEIFLDNRKEGEIAEVILRVRYPCENLKKSNKTNIITTNNKITTEKDIKLNKEINDLKNIITDQEKIINNYKNENQNLKEKIINLKNIINDKEKIINEKNILIKDFDNNNEKLRNEIKNLKNEINEIKEKKSKEINDLIKSDLKHEKIFELIKKLDEKEK